MSLTRKEVQWYTKRLYKFMKEGHRIEFKKHRGFRGFIFEDPEGTGTALVTLDYRDKLLSTLIHEVLHHIHPTWSETDILDMESKVVNALSDRQIRTIIKRLAEVI